MALIHCKECGGQLSSEAAACPHCGKPNTPSATGAATAAPPKVDHRLGIVVLAIAAGLVIYMISTGNTGAAGEAPKSEAASCAAGDLQCLGDIGTSAASVYCKDDIEHLATHSVKWTDGTFESKFSRFRWKDKAAGTITYIGDKAEFQNGFGAYSPVTYECDLEKDGKTVDDVRVTAGRLPVSR